jgi:hypothetical protein
MAYMCEKRSGWVCTGCDGCQSENILICEHCDDEIVGNSYWDDTYDVLCKDCLLELHQN